MATGLNAAARVVRAAAAWAIGRIAAAAPKSGATEMLRARLEIEEDATVRGEILDALPDGNVPMPEPCEEQP